MKLMSLATVSRGVLVATATLALGQGPAQAAEADDIRALLDLWETTYATASTAEDLRSFYHADAVYWGTLHPDPLVGWTAIGGFLQDQLASYSQRSVEFGHPTIVVITPDLAVAIGTSSLSVTVAGGERIDAEPRYTMTFLRTAKGWEIVEQHSSVILPAAAP
ncbi:MAG: nuclear transport factor 2 family protein [Bauldia sp.]|nr:nuclear transport factor 2 family protein [Bauldia sp.]